MVAVSFYCQQKSSRYLQKTTNQYETNKKFRSSLDFLKMYYKVISETVLYYVMWQNVLA